MQRNAFKYLQSSTVVMTSGVFFSVALPTIGVILSTIQLAVPFATILECRKQGTIGPLNPVPWVSSWINCFGWMVYGVVIQDFYIMMSVLFGTVLNFYATTTALTLLGAHNEFKKAKEVELIGIGGITVWLVIGLVVGTGIVTGTASQLLAGTVVLCSGIFYYISPISSAAQVLKEWDASSLALPMLLLNAAASGIWAVYGFTIMDPFVYGLNTFGLLVSVFFVAVKMVLPSAAEASGTDANASEKVELPEETHIIVGTVRSRGSRAGTLEGGLEHPIRIAISGDSYQQFVSGSGGQGMGVGVGVGLQIPASRSRASSCAIGMSPAYPPPAYGDSGAWGSGLLSPMHTGSGSGSGAASDSIITRISRANTVKEVVHEIVETLVPEVNFDPLQAFVADLEAGAGAGAGADSRDPNTGRTLPLLPARKVYEPPSPSTRSDIRLTAITEEEALRSLSFSEPQL